MPASDSAADEDIEAGTLMSSKKHLLFRLGNLLKGIPWASRPML